MEDGGSSGKHLKDNSRPSNNKHVVFSSVISTVIPDHGSAGRPDSQINVKGIEHGSVKDSDSSYSASSTSSNSTSDDFIQLNPQILPKFRVQNNIPKPNGATNPLYKSEKPNVLNDGLYRLKESVSEPPKSIPRVSDVAHESLVAHVAPTQPPTIQVMERTGGFDPNRIPASIFSKPLPTPMEWSVASNDSLFSIHIGNSSFSRDHVSSMGIDLPKSVELFISEELCNSGELYQSMEHATADMKRSDDLIGWGQTFPTTEGVRHEKSLDMAKTIGEDMNIGRMGMIDEPISYVPTALVNNQIETSVEESTDSPCANHCHSDKSETTIQPSSFARKKKSSCVPCHCSDCCRIFCCCKWCCKLPSCCCKWSSCSCKWIHWPSCFTDCLSWKSCCCKWPSCHCKCLTWSSCCCKYPSWPSCSCLSCHNCRCASWPSCKLQCSNCSWACCYCWKHEPKRVCCDSSHVCSSTDGRINACNQHATLPNSVKATKKQWSCFSCSSTCSCCACCSCSCCC